MTRIITRKTNQQATKNFTMYPSQATAIYNFIQYGIQKKNCNCMIKKLFTGPSLSLSFLY